jgi:hypothetical protein
LSAADGPFAVDDRERHTGNTLRTRFGYLMVYLGQALVGFQEADCLKKPIFKSAIKLALASGALR